MEKISTYSNERGTLGNTDRFDVSADLGGGSWESMFLQWSTLKTNLSSAGFLTSFTETDPVFSAHPASNVVDNLATNQYLSGDGTYQTLPAGGLTANTDLFLPVSDGSALQDSLLRQNANTGAVDLYSDAVNHVYRQSGTTDVDSLKMIAELISGKGRLTFDGLTGALFVIEDDKDGILFGTSDVSGNLLASVDADWLIRFGNPFNSGGYPFELVYDSITGDTEMKLRSQTWSVENIPTYLDQASAISAGLQPNQAFLNLSQEKSICVI